MKFKYKNAIFGGTFDHLHIGHKTFIDHAFSHARNITIGLAVGALLEKKPILYALEDYSTREKNLVSYLDDINCLDCFRIVSISDIYGISLKMQDVEAIFVTEDLVRNAEKINEKRKELGMSVLAIDIVPRLTNEDGQEVTASRIRMGEMDRDGYLYSQFFEGKDILRLADEMRPTLQEPFGEVIPDIREYDFSDDSFVIAVGDIVVARMVEIGRIPEVSVFDKRTQRGKITDTRVTKFLPKAFVEVANEKGTINFEAANEIQRSISASIDEKKCTAVKVDGEEDLLALPAILFAPLESIVVYGLREKGAVVVRVTEEKKKEVLEILKKFE